MSQPVPGVKWKPAYRVMDRVPIPNWHPNHVLGKPILPQKLRDVLPGAMLSFHDGVLELESRMLKEKNLTYPVIFAKVPESESLGFVTEYPAELLVVRFDDIFRMFHMQPLSPSMVRLIALSMAHQICKEGTPEVAIIDPFWMQEQFVNNPRGKAKATKYLEHFFLSNQHKNCFLLPYFPE